MRIKFNRGPMNGQRIMQDVATDVIHYRLASPINYNFKSFDNPAHEVIQARVGEYRRSYNTLKDGTIIFEWMGWTDGKGTIPGWERPRRRTRSRG